MKKLSLLFFLLICSVLIAGPAMAVIYKYVDDNGHLVFVDDESKIPPQHRQKTAPIKERTDNLTSEELEAYQEQLTEERSERLLRRKAQRETELNEQRNEHQTPVMIRGNRVMVSAEVAVRNRVAHVILLLDTGASRTVLHRPSLEKLPLKEGEKGKAQIAGGHVIPTEKVTVRYLDVGPFREKSAEIMLLDPVRPNLPYDGLLGNDFLRRHPYTIDYEKEVIYWDLSGE